MPLTKKDRELLQRCLAHKRGAWNDFVDRFLGLFYHVVRHTAYLRSISLSPEDTEDMVADVLLTIISGDYALLRHFRGKSSLATYLTVIARRISVHALAQRSAAAAVQPSKSVEEQEIVDPAKPKNLGDVEEVEKLLAKLPKKERKVVRLRVLEGRSYEEISIATGIPVNNIGPILHRAKKRLRKDKGKDKDKDTNGAVPKEKKKKPKSSPKVEKTDEAEKKPKSKKTEQPAAETKPESKKAEQPAAETKTESKKAEEPAAETKAEPKSEPATEQKPVEHKTESNGSGDHDSKPKKPDPKPTEEKEPEAVAKEEKSDSIPNEPKA